MAESHIISRMNKEMQELRKENKTLKTRISTLEKDLSEAEARAESVERSDERDDMYISKYNHFGLSAKEMRLFYRLLEKPEGSSKPGLMNALYASDGDREYFMDPKIIDVYVCKIRRKITENSHFNGHKLIKTERARGYKINPALRPSLEEALGYTAE